MTKRQSLAVAMLLHAIALCVFGTIFYAMAMIDPWLAQLAWFPWVFTAFLIRDVTRPTRRDHADYL